MVKERALATLLKRLKNLDYDFTPVTPATHARVLARSCTAPTLRDIFGWNRPFTREDLPSVILECLQAADAINGSGDTFRSVFRVAALDGELFLHSCFPTSSPDAVFFGPDTYRFARFIQRYAALDPPRPRCIADIGTGSGAGAVIAAKLWPDAAVTATDVNPRALELAQVNVQVAATSIELVRASTIPNGVDLVIANPPYMMDEEKRAYRDGGDLHGGRLALEWVDQALTALTPAGRMLLYTGAAIINGRSPLVDALHQRCASAGARLAFYEYDPDVFGEELERPAYGDVERIAVICATIIRAS